MITDEALRVCWVPGLNVISGRPTLDIRAWLGRGSFQVDPQSTDQKIILSVGSNEEFLQALAVDVNRIGSSIEETYQSISEVKNLPKSLAWLMIKLYYAAFFSAHVILRTHGVACTYLTAADLLEFKKIGKIYGASALAGLSSGYYIFAIDTHTKNVTISVQKSGLGSHEQLWAEFHRQLLAMRASVQAAPFLEAKYKTQIDKEYEVLSDVLTGGGAFNGNWLSKMRNDVNYRQEHGVWFPYGSKVAAKEWVHKMEGAVTGASRVVPTVASADVKKFIEACIYMVAMARGTLCDMQSSCTNGKSFLCYGHKNILDLISA